jgi:hypothetical protein
MSVVSHQDYRADQSRRRRTNHLDHIIDWYFANIWRGRVLVTLPFACMMTALELELIARAYIHLFR